MEEEKDRVAVDGNTRMSQRRRDREVVWKWRKEKNNLRENAHWRASLSMWAQSTRAVIISQFGVFWMDQYRAGIPRAQGLWFTMEPVYYSDCVFVWSACKWGLCIAERQRQKVVCRTKGESEQGGVRRETQLYLLSLFTGKVRGIEGDNLDTLLPRAPQPAILLLCPSALRPPGTPSDGGRTTPISLCPHPWNAFTRPQKQSLCMDSKVFFYE